MDYDIVIAGGGAAGLMCAIEAGKRGRTVLVIERAAKAGRKILISGGGRCNFTNLHASPSNFVSSNPHFCKSALARYTPWDFVDLVDRHSIAYHEKEAGQLFCDVTASAIVTMLLDECCAHGAQVEVNRTIERVVHVADRYVLAVDGESIRCESLVVATGGLSIPAMGTGDWGYALAKQFGHHIVPTRAALVPLRLSADQFEPYADLSGVALPVEAICKQQRFAAGMLITHRGLSGPAILQISTYWQEGEEVLVNLAPGIELVDWLVDRQSERPTAELSTLLATIMPRRLAHRLCERWLESRPMRQYRAADLRRIAEMLQAWRFRPIGTEGYKTAEVTLGGVSADELSSATMESRYAPGLYFIGEVVDVTGQLGGFNFQWAWSSGFAAGQVV